MNKDRQTEWIIDGRVWSAEDRQKQIDFQFSDEFYEDPQWWKNIVVFNDDTSDIRPEEFGFGSADGTIPPHNITVYDVEMGP
jgi:hypothetical protein